MHDALSEIRRFVTELEFQIKELAKEYDVENLGGPQGMTVFYLWKNRDKEIYIKDIENKLSISKSVASNLIKRMEKNHFIEVVPSVKDKRCKQVILTNEGLAKSKKIEDFHIEMNKILFKDIQVKDLRTSLRVFKKLQKNIEKGEK
ncbi:MAG: MarR family winged helix-turn-helix transcriptional regulator [Streptococcus sp.]|nr:MarR family winged helix-turn-helix transcriptional regulator [Streptococcus sp.]